MGSTNKKPTNSHAARRFWNWLHVAVIVSVVLALVILINAMAYRAYLRTDLTRGGSYSLSAQTKAVLDKLDDGYRLVTLLPEGSSAVDDDTARVYRDVRDMADEYARYAGGLAVEHIDPRSDITQAESLNSAIAETFDDELKPVIDAINLGRETLNTVKPINTKLIAVLMSGLNPESDQPATRTEEFLQAAALRFQQFGQTADQANEQADELLDQVLINYAQVKNEFQGVLTDYDKVLDVVIQSSEQLVRSPETRNADKERLLESIELCTQVRAELVEPIQIMQAAADAPRFHHVLYGLTGGASVVAIGPNRVKVVPVSEMWRQDLRDYEETGQVQPQYLIEEKMTGALLSMTLDQPPLVVFVLSGSGAAVGTQGRFNIVAQRLMSADFQVTQWNPAGQVSAMGQPTPPTPRPEPEPGQKAIWIVLPTPSPQSGNPMMMAANPRQQIAELLRERLDAGDTAMVVLTADPAAAYGMANPITDLLVEWGLTVQIDRLILNEVPQANRRNATVMRFLVDSWPDTLPITTALNGMQAAFLAASPIQIGDMEGITHHPLVTLTGNRMWTHAELTSIEAVQNATFSEADSAPSYTIATASEKDGTRLITSAEEVWASDDMTGYGLIGPGTAELTGAMFPGNSELFVNSVYWLAGLEDLIAASPRSQDVPRIRPMTARKLWWHQVALIVGLPLAALVLGLGVWWVRRRA